MPDYHYIAREASGRQVTGVLSAGSDHEVLRTLAQKSLFPVRVEPAQSAKVQKQQSGRRVRMRHLAMFYTQLADLLHSGVPLLRSLDLLERKSPVVPLRLAVQDVRQQVADLADAHGRNECAPFQLHRIPPNDDGLTSLRHFDSR